MRSCGPGVSRIDPQADSRYVDVEELDISQVDDEGLIHLASLTRPKRLYLAKTPITDAGLIHLHGLPTLTWLDRR